MTLSRILEMEQIPARADKMGGWGAPSTEDRGHCTKGSQETVRTGVGRCPLHQDPSLLLLVRLWLMDFPGGQVVRTPHLHCRR